MATHNSKERVGLLLFDLVRPILSQALLGLGLSEAVCRGPQFFSTSEMGRDFKSSFASGFDVGFALGFSAIVFAIVCLLWVWRVDDSALWQFFGHVEACHADPVIGHSVIDVEPVR